MQCSLRTSKLTECFKELRSEGASHLNVGYIEPGHGYKRKQRWINGDDDLHEMYSIYSGKNEILLWCFLPGKPSKRHHPYESSSNANSRCNDSTFKKISEVQDVVVMLQSKCGAKFKVEQYHAWAQLIQIGRHTSHEEPPNFPFFRQLKKETSGSRIAPSATGVSPGKRVHLRTELFTKLEKLSHLCDSGSIMKEQHEELKKSIMDDIKEL